MGKSTINGHFQQLCNKLPELIAMGNGFNASEKYEGESGELGYVGIIIANICWDMLGLSGSMEIPGSNRWRYVNVPYVWPYFVGIFPEI